MIEDWLSEKGSAHAKHRGWQHPITVCLLHYTVVFAVTFWTHDLLIRNLTTTSMASSATSITDSTQQAAANNSSIHYPAQEELERRAFVEPNRCHRYRMSMSIVPVWLLMWRLAHHQRTGNCVLYEYCWLCNMTLNLSAVGLYCQRPVIAGACCVVGLINCFGTWT
jgi:hypothetical protein